MGWGPVDWVGRVLTEAKFEKKYTSFFEIFLFERPIPRYLLIIKTARATDGRTAAL